MRSLPEAFPAGGGLLTAALQTAAQPQPVIQFRQPRRGRRAVFQLQGAVAGQHVLHSAPPERQLRFQQVEVGMPVHQRAQPGAHTFRIAQPGQLATVVDESIRSLPGVDQTWWASTVSVEKESYWLEPPQDGVLLDD